MFVFFVIVRQSNAHFYNCHFFRDFKPGDYTSMSRYLCLFTISNYLIVEAIVVFYDALITAIHKFVIFKMFFPLSLLDLYEEKMQYF